MIRYTIRQLTFLHETAQQGGIAQAARILNVSPAAIASALGKLEDLTGLKLFDRFPAQGMRLTRVGKDFAIRAEAFLAQAEALDRFARDLASGESGALHIGTHYALVQPIVLPSVIAQRSRHPGIRIEIIENDIETLVAALDAREVDALLVFEHRFDPRRHVTEILLDLQPMALLPADHYLAGQAEVSLSDLRDLPYLTVSGAGPGQSYLNMLEAAGFKPDIPLTSQSRELVHAYVGKGFGFTLVGFPPSQGRTIEGDLVVTVPIRERIGSLKVILARPRDAWPSPFLDSFLEFCRFQAAENS